MVIFGIITKHLWITNSSNVVAQAWKKSGFWIDAVFFVFNNQTVIQWHPCTILGSWFCLWRLRHHGDRSIWFAQWVHYNSFLCRILTKMTPQGLESAHSMFTHTTLVLLSRSRCWGIAFGNSFEQIRGYFLHQTETTAFQPLGSLGYYVTWLLILKGLFISKYDRVSMGTPPFPPPPFILPHSTWSPTVFLVQ